MSLMDRVLRRRRYEPAEDTSVEARAAVAAAQESQAQAERDLAEQQEKLPEARALTRTLRAHNDANHYAAWLAQVGINPGRT